MKKELIFKNLTHMVSLHEMFFEEDLAKFMLTSLGKDFLKSQEVEGRNIRNWNVKASFFGFIKMKFIGAYNITHNQEYYDSLSENQGINKNKLSENLIKEINEEKQKLAKWTDLLNNVSPDLIADSSCSLSVWMKDDKKISFNAYFALSHLGEWASNYIKNPQDWKLTPEEEKLVVEDLTQRAQSYDLSSLLFYKKTDEMKLILSLYERHCESVKKDFLMPKNGNQPTQENWIEKLFNSESIKNILEQANPEDLKNFFDDESLKTLIKRANLKKNIQNFPDMLANLMPIATPSSWIEAYSGKTSFNINSFFDNLATRAYGHSLTKGYLKTKKARYAYPVAQEAFRSEIQYLSPVLNSTHIKQNDLIKFWDTIIFISVQRSDQELFKMICKNVELPSVDETLASKDFDKKYNNASINRFTSQGTENIYFKDLYFLAQEEKLSELLKEKKETINQSRKVKI